MKSVVLMFAIGAANVVLFGCAQSPAGHNKEIARRVFSEVLSDGRFERAAELYSPGFLNTVFTATWGSRTIRTQPEAGSRRFLIW